MVENWIQVDESEDVAGSIRHAIRTVDFVRDDPQAWKWVAIALHSSLQGACVCHLTTTAVPLGAVIESNAKQWIAYFETSRTDQQTKPPKTYLMALPELLKAVRKPHSAGDGSNDAGVSINENELQWLCRFHDQIRNQFVHFSVMNWSIEISGIAEIAAVISRIIQEIELIGWAFRHMHTTRRKDLKLSLKELANVDWPTQ